MVIDARTGNNLPAGSIEEVDKALSGIIASERMKHVMRKGKGSIMAGVGRATESTVNALLDARLAHMAVRGELAGCEYCQFDAIVSQ